MIITAYPVKSESLEEGISRLFKNGIGRRRVRIPGYFGHFISGVFMPAGSRTM